MLLFHERLTKMSDKFPTIRVINAAVFATISDCQSQIHTLNIMSTIANAKNHWIMLMINVLLPKSGSFGERGLRDIIFSSSCSPSKIIEHAGSMSNSINTMCIG